MMAAAIRNDVAVVVAIIIVVAVNVVAVVVVFGSCQVFSKYFKAKCCQTKKTVFHIKLRKLFG